MPRKRVLTYEQKIPKVFWRSGTKTWALTKPTNVGTNRAGSYPTYDPSLRFTKRNNFVVGEAAQQTKTFPDAGPPIIPPKNPTEMYLPESILGFYLIGAPRRRDGAHCATVGNFDQYSFSTKNQLWSKMNFGAFQHVGYLGLELEPSIEFWPKFGLASGKKKKGP